MGFLDLGEPGTVLPPGAPWVLDGGMRTGGSLGREKTPLCLKLCTTLYVFRPQTLQFGFEEEIPTPHLVPNLIPAFLDCPFL